MRRTTLIRTILRSAARYAGTQIVVKLDDSVTAEHDLDLAEDLAALQDAEIRPTIVCSTSRGMPFAQKDISLHLYPQQDNKHSDSLSVDLALAQGASKLLYLTPYDGIFDCHRRVISQMDLDEVNRYVSNNKGGRPAVTGSMREKLVCALRACSLGIPRVHLINGTREGALLEEMLLDEGIGTLITAANASYMTVRQAQPTDIHAIALLLAACEVENVTADAVARRINDFFVLAVDGNLQGCCSISSGTATIVEFFALAEEFDNRAANELMLTEIVRRAGDSRQILAKPRNHIWFLLDPSLARFGYTRKHAEAPGHVLWVKGR